VYSAANRPWPTLAADPVTDYLIMEAVAVKAAQEDEEARKKAEREHEVEEWRGKAQERLAEYG
jgi:hypothetical protein